MSDQTMAELAMLHWPYFSARIFLWACAGAIVAEGVRLRNLRRDADLRWSPSYPMVSGVFVLLSGLIAWILWTYTRAGAFYIGFSTPILISSLCKAKAPRRIVSRPKDERPSRPAKSIADRMIEESEKLRAAMAQKNQPRFFEPPKLGSLGAPPPPSLPAQRMALLTALKARSHQSFEAERLVDDELGAHPFWKSIRTDFLNGI